MEGSTDGWALLFSIIAGTVLTAISAISVLTFLLFWPLVVMVIFILLSGVMMLGEATGNVARGWDDRPHRCNCHNFDCRNH